MADNVELDPDDSAAAVVAEYLEALVRLPYQHADGWALMTFDLRARMARLMTADVDRVDPRAVSTVLDGPTPGNFIWDAFEGWHASNVGRRWRIFYLLGVRLHSEGTDDDTRRLVHMDGLPDSPHADHRSTFELVYDDGWKVDRIPEAAPGPPGEHSPTDTGD